MAVKDRHELLDAPYTARLRSLFDNLAREEIAQLGSTVERALHGDSRAASAYVRSYRRLTRALLTSAAESRPELFVIGATCRVELQSRSGARAGWIGAALDQSAAEAPFSRWAALLGLREGVAMHALASLRALIPDSPPLDAPATDEMLPISDIDARRFLRGVRRQLDTDQPQLERIQEIFGLNNTELGTLFGVSRQGVKEWIEGGVPAGRQDMVATVAAIADLLERKLKLDRIPGVARRPADAYGGLTMLDLISQGRERELLDITRRSFDWATAA
jgi:hypothetical protein